MTTYDDTTDLPVETHQAPADIPKADPQDLADPDEARVSIAGGLSDYAIANPPALGEERTYVVRSTCKERRKKLDPQTGEIVMHCVMEHTTIYDRALGPFGDPNQGALFDDAGNEAVEADQ